MIKHLSVEGMSCKHCVNRVKKYLETVGTNVSVDLEGKKADFNAESDVDMATVIKEISEFGFTVKEI
ncbi:heavy-metal-associated domain-containing protein [Desulfobacter postgatei]|uniref:Copper chaperone n=1 Tax=Desulfobacter postgatei 2ac9 TaxID=879212 RepID=I5B3C5_9BACT|nr:heavy-metal-associated domain-containing protein [Desulfobacter postgatei]EIM63988.1 copper chaperone [Desulfobacter postgatei 2ac9]